jgi:NAD(P)-dependent dehydrogenase (short-subunit alcohol dehydrogenase family)
MPLDSLQGRHILVLGGSDGMGYATSSYLLRSKANVTICARTASKLEAAHHRLLGETGAAPDQLRSMALDARDAAAVDKSVALAANTSGELDGVFVVAGGANFIAVDRHTPESIAEEWAMNMFPLVNAVTSAVPRMKRAGGSIVALSSGASVRTYPGLSAYGAAKAGLDHYVRVAADELGRHKIRVNAVQPGLTKNGSNAAMLQDTAYTSTFDALTPLGPYGQPEDFAPMVSLLLSEETSWITGQVFAIDGGMTLRAYGGRLAPPQ